MPREHNRGIHRSIDNAQEDLIKKYNARIQENQAALDVQMVLEYCQNVIARIIRDNDEGGFLYPKCKNEDVETYLKTVQSVLDTFEAKSKYFQNPGRDFYLDMQNYGDLDETQENNRRERLKQAFQRNKRA